MRDAHCPTDDHVASLLILVSNLLNLLATNSTAPFDIVPCQIFDMTCERLKTIGGRLMNSRLTLAPLNDDLADAHEQRRVTANIELNVSAGNLAAEQQTAHIARNAEVDQPGFDQRIDHDDFATMRRIFISERIKRG